MDVAKSGVPGGTVTDVSGVGDKAFFITAGSGGGSLLVLKGLVLVTVTVQGVSSDQAKSASIALATKAVASF